MFKRCVNVNVSVFVIENKKKPDVFDQQNAFRKCWLKHVKWFPFEVASNQIVLQCT